MLSKLKSILISDPVTRAEAALAERDRIKTALEKAEVADTALRQEEESANQALELAETEAALSEGSLAPDTPELRRVSEVRANRHASGLRRAGLRKRLSSAEAAGEIALAEARATLGADLNEFSNQLISNVQAELAAAVQKHVLPILRRAQAVEALAGYDLPGLRKLEFFDLKNPGHPHIEPVNRIVEVWPLAVGQDGRPLPHTDPEPWRLDADAVKFFEANRKLVDMAKRLGMRPS